VFAEAKRKGVDMMALGAEMKARKPALIAQAEGESLPRPEAKSMGKAKRADGEGMGDCLRTIALKAKRATIG
jgi:hypothetical protein